nr:MAG TPA: Terminase large subunit [Caudoviricetes sp.]
MDEMVFETPCGDITYPGYHSVNNDDYSQRKYPGSIPLIYNLKSNGTLDSQIHAAAYAMLNSGKVIFLTREQEAKNKLLATQAGQKMTLEKRARRLMPHELTTRLFEELTNLRLKQTGSNDVRLERINTNMGKDKWSALEYGLYRLKQMEDDYILKTKKNKRGKRKLAFFTAGR